MNRSDAKGSKFLDRLRQQSDAVRAAETPRRSTEDILLDMDQRLWRVYRFLDEALAHLAVIKPVVAHDFRVDQLLSLSGLQFEQGFVSYRRRHLAGQDLLDYVEAFYRLTGSQPMKFRAPPTSVATVENRLRNAGIPFRYEPEVDERKSVKAGVFLITPSVTASVRFDPDYRSQEIGVRLTNVDRFESVNLEFKPEQFDDASFEDLVRMMLGESNAYLRRAPLAGIGAARKAPAIDEPVAYRVEKTLRQR
jgi:hypothetical protein